MTSADGLLTFFNCPRSIHSSTNFIIFSIYHEEKDAELVERGQSITVNEVHSSYVFSPTKQFRVKSAASFDGCKLTCYGFIRSTPQDGSFTIHGMADLEDVCTSLAFQQVR